METVNFLKSHLVAFHDLSSNEKNVVLFLGLVCLFLFFYLRSRNKGKRLTGPIGFPIVGYFPFLSSEPHKTFLALSKKYGNIFRVYLGSQYVVVCNDWTAVKDALCKSETLYRPPKVFDAIPNGLGFASKNGQEWSEQRRFIMKALKDNGFGRPQWEDVSRESINEIIEKIQTLNGQPTDVEKMIGSTFTNNVMTLTFGHRLPSDDPMLHKIHESMKYLTQVVPVIDFNFFLPKLGFLLSTMGILKTDFPKFQEKVEEFIEAVDNCVSKALKHQDSEEQDSFLKTYQKEVQNNKEKNLKNTFTDESRNSNVNTLLVGGSDTSKHAFIWLLISMAKFSTVQDRVHKELDKIIGKDGMVKWGDRNKVPYTFATIMESMRWFILAPIPALRMVNENTSILGYDVPKGAYIVSNFYNLSKDPKYWTNPDEFQPERFLLDNGKQINFKAESFTPFSYGKRMCPGEMIAQMTLLSYFTAIMQKFKVLPPEGEDVKYDVVPGLTTSAQNVKLRFILRD